MSGRFTFNSGLESPIKIESDRIRANQEAHDMVCCGLAEVLLEQGYMADVIVGVIGGGVSFARETAGILKLRWAARLGNTDTPEKRQQVTGEIKQDDRVVILEDVVTRAGNSLACAHQTIQEGGVPIMVLSVFDWGFGVAQERFAQEHLTHYSLTDFDYLLRYVDSKLQQQLKSWHMLSQMG